MSSEKAASKEWVDSNGIDLIALLLIGTNFAVLTLLLFKAYVSCSLNGFDVGLYNQIMHNMASGNFSMDASLNWHHSQFAVHNQSIMYLFLPIYALFPSVFTLGVIQVLTLSLAALALYRLSVVKLGNKMLGLLILAAFLVYEYSWGPVVVTFFHPEVFSLLALIAAFYYLEKGRLIPCFLFTTLAMMCKENVATIAVTLGIYIFLVKKRKAGLLLSLWGVIWFFGSTLILIPLARGASVGQVWYVDRYSYLGRSTAEILAGAAQYPGIVLHVLTAEDKLGYLYALFSPLFFLPLLSPVTVLIALPIFLQNLLSAYVADFSPTERDVFPIIAFLFISLVYAVDNVNRLLKKGSRGTLRGQSAGVFYLLRALGDKSTAFVALALLLVILLNVGRYPLFVGSAETELLREFPDTPVASRLEIPYLEQFSASQSCREVVLYLAEHAAPTAVLTVPAPLLAFSTISGRSRVYDFSIQRRVEEADYLVIPASHISTQANPGYELALDADDFVVLRKKGIEESSDTDVPSTLPTTTASADVPPVDLLDLRNASIRGALFVTKETWSIDGDEREVIFEYPQIYNLARVTYAQVPIPADAGLKFGIGMNPEVWDRAGDGVLLEILVNREPLFSRYLDPKHNEEDRMWHDFEVDLAGYAGQTVEISFLAAPNNTNGDNSTYDWAGWANPRIVVGQDPQRVYDFIASIGEASSVDADVGSDYHMLARHRRRVLLQHPTAEDHPAELTYSSVFVPSNAFLQFATGMQTQVWDKAGDGVRFEILIDGEGIFSQYIDPKQNDQDRRWHDFELSLEKYAGQEVEVTFLVAPNQDYQWDWAVWADPHITVKGAP